MTKEREGDYFVVRIWKDAVWFVFILTLLSSKGQTRLVANYVLNTYMLPISNPATVLGIFLVKNGRVKSGPFGFLMVWITEGVTLFLKVPKNYRIRYTVKIWHNHTLIQNFPVRMARNARNKLLSLEKQNCNKNLPIVFSKPSPLVCYRKLWNVRH